jgi:hypothetical protein
MFFLGCGQMQLPGDCKSLIALLSVFGYISLSEAIMLNAVHFLLTYQCTGECDHCFLYCSPEAAGVFTIDAVKKALAQMKEIESVDTAYFEGGEPFLYYPLLVESVRLARGMGYSVGIVSNSYWATSEADAMLWLRPLADLGIADLSVSDDVFHNPESGPSPAQIAKRAAAQLGIPCESICIEAPKVITDDKKWAGRPVVGGDVLFKGRAVDKLLADLPHQNYRAFTDCPHEELKSPERVHLDPFGNVHVCQGIVIGNINETPLARIISDYSPKAHPIIGPLVSGGPAQLAEAFGFNTSPGFVSHCHLCFEVRRALLDRYPAQLAPRQVYGR